VYDADPSCAGIFACALVGRGAARRLAATVPMNARRSITRSPDPPAAGAMAES
jgi:hypothetical protein